jgi:TonB family protein
MNFLFKITFISIIFNFVASTAFSQTNMLADIPNRDPNDPVYSYVEKMPELYGGKETFKMYQDYYPYPTCGLERKLQGKVVLQFIVELNGTLSDIKVLSSPDECLSTAAVGYLHTWPKWTPAMVKDKPVSSLFTLPIDYNLENFNKRPK